MDDTPLGSPRNPDVPAFARPKVERTEAEETRRRVQARARRALNDPDAADPSLPYVPPGFAHAPDPSLGFSATMADLEALLDATAAMTPEQVRALIESLPPAAVNQFLSLVEARTASTD